MIKLNIRFNDDIGTYYIHLEEFDITPTFTLIDCDGNRYGLYISSYGHKETHVIDVSIEDIELGKYPELSTK